MSVRKSSRRVSVKPVQNILGKKWGKKSILALAAVAAAECLWGMGGAKVAKADLTWDSDASAANGITDGAGIWNLATTNWYNGTNVVAWSNAAPTNAIFGGTGTGNFTISLGGYGGITATGLVFNTSGTNLVYTIAQTGTNAVQTLTLNSGTVSVSAGGSAVIGTVIGGTNGLTKLGAGILRIGGTNALTYTGLTTVSSGILELAGNQTDKYADFLINNGATLRYLSVNPIVNTSNVTNNGTFEFNNLTDTLGAITGSGVFSNTGGTVVNMSLDLNGLNTTFSGAITGNLGLFLRGNTGTQGGSLTLTGTNNTYNGNVTIGATALANTNKGVVTLRAGANNVLAHGAGKGNLVINSNIVVGAQNGVFDTNGFTTTVNALTGGGALISGGGSTVNGVFNSSFAIGNIDGIVTNSAAGTTGTLVIGDNNAGGQFDGSIVDGAGKVAITKIGTGTLTLTGKNTYSGQTLLNANSGFLSAVDGKGLSSNSNLSIQGGALLTYGNFIRSLGTGAGQVQFGNAGANGEGLVAINGPLNIDLGGDGTGTGGTLVWGSQFFNPAVLLLGSGSGNNVLTLRNAIDLNSGISDAVVRQLNVNGALTNTVTLSGVISNSGTGFGSLTKFNAGLVVLSGANTYNGTTSFTGGVLRANDGVGLPTASNLSLTGAIFETGANFLRGIGTGANQVQLLGGTAGFSAFGANVVVDLGGDGSGTGAGLVWGTSAGNLNVGTLVLNEVTANGTLDFKNAIDLNAGTNATVTRTINANSTAGASILSGALSNSGTGLANLTKGGSGLLLLNNAANTFNGTTTISAGVLQYGSSGSIGGPGGAVILVNAAAAVASGPAFGTITDQLFPRIITASTGAIALGANSAENLDLGAAGLGNMSLGAVGLVNYTGTLTPASGSYRLGGGSGILTLSNVNALTGTNVAIVQGTGGTVALSASNDFTGGTILRGSSLAVSDAAQLGTGGITFNAGTLAITGTSFNYAGLITDSTSGGNIQVDTGADGIISSGFGTNGTPGRIQKTGGGVLRLTGANQLAGGGFHVRNGSLILSGSGSLATTAFSDVGLQFGDSATLIVKDSATLSVTGGDFNVTDLTGSKGFMFIQDSATVSVRNIYIGKNGSSSGVVVQTGGTLNLGATESHIAGTTSTADAASNGTYDLSGGVVNIGANLQVGAWGTGGMTINGGTATITAGFPSIGRNIGSYGVLTLLGGSFTDSNTGTFLIIGEQGAGVLNLQGGVVSIADVAASAGLRLGHNAGYGVANLAAGAVLQTASVTQANLTQNTGIFNFHGGTLRSPTTAAAITLMGGLTSGYIWPEGAIVENNGANNQTITQNLIVPTGNGITSLAVSSGGTGYVGTPVVQIAGGGGLGATAIPIIAGGVITGFTITNPGVGYTSTPTVTIIGGGGSGAAAGAATLAANTSTGGFTKIGTGDITLSGADNFDGLTQILAGRLIVGSDTALGTTNGATYVSNGAAIVFNSARTIGNESLTASGTGPGGGGAIRAGGSASSIYGGAVTLEADTFFKVDGAAALNFTNPNGISSAVNPNITAQVDGTLAMTVAGPVAIGTGSVTKTGTGILQFNSPNPYSGSVQVLGGILGVASLTNGGSPSGLGVSSASATNLLLSGGQIRYSGSAAASTDRTFTFGTGGAGFDTTAPSGAAPVVWANTTAPVMVAGVAARTFTLSGTNLDFNIFAAPLSDDLVGVQQVLVTKSGAGFWALTGANTYTGLTTISGGVLRATEGVNLPFASPLTLSGGQLETAANVTRALGTGSNEVQITGGASGFSAAGGSTVIVDIGGDGTGTGPALTWGTTTFNPSVLFLQSGTGAGGNGALTLTNGIDLNPGTGTARNFNVPGILNGATNTAKISGNLTSTGTGVASIIKNGFGNLVLSGVNAFAGTVNINQGSLTITNSSGLGTGTKVITINNGTTGNPQLHLDGTAGSITLPSTFTYVTSNLGGSFWNDAGTNTVNGAITMTTGGGQTRFVSSAGNIIFNGAISPNTTGRTLNLSGDGNGVINGVISSGSTVGLPVIKDGGTGSWTLTGLNTFTGAVQVTAGNVIAGTNSLQNAAAGAFGGGTVALSLGATNGTLNSGVFINGPYTVGRGITLLAGNTGLNTIGTVTDTAGTFSGTITLGNNLSIAVGASSAGVANISGPIVGSGSVTIVGPGTAVVSSNSNTYTGGTLLTGGTLSVGSNLSLGAATSAVTIGNATLLASSTFSSPRSVALTSANSGISIAGTNTLSLTGVISGTGTLNASGPLGTLSLTGANQYSGGTIINGGTVSVGAASNSLGSGAVTLNSGTLNIPGGLGTVAYGNNINLSGTSTIIIGPGSFGAFGLSTFSGGTTNVDGGAGPGGGDGGTSGGTVCLIRRPDSNAIEQIDVGKGSMLWWQAFINGDQISGGTSVAIDNGSLVYIDTGHDYVPINVTTANSTIDATGSNFVTLTGAIQGAGTLNKGFNSGTLALSGTNSYLGGTIIKGGTLSVAADSNLGDAAGGITIGSATLNASATFSSSRPVTLSSPNSAISISGANTLTLNGPVTGSGTLNVTGAAGTLALNGNNTYQGGTLVNGSTVQAGASATALGIGAVTLNNGTLNFPAGLGTVAYGNNLIFGGISNINVGAGSFAAMGTATGNGGGTVVVNVNPFNPGTTGGTVCMIPNPTDPTTKIVVAWGGVLWLQAVMSDPGVSAITTTLDVKEATLQYDGSFTEGAPITLDHPNSTIDVSSGQTTTLLGAFSGTGTLNKGPSAGTLVLAQGGTLSLPAVTVNGGALHVSGTTTLSVAGTLTVNSGAEAKFLSGPTRLTHVANTLTMNGNANLDLNNHELLTNTAPNTIKTYLANAFDPFGNLDWGLKGLTSSVAKANPTSYSVGYAYGGDTSAQDAGVTTHGSAALGATQTIARAVLAGDTNMDGTVDFFDLTQVLGYKYNAGTPASYTDGDLDYNGTVDFFDFSVVLSANYNSGQTYGPASAHSGLVPSATKSPAAQTPTLTGAHAAAFSAEAIASVTAIGTSGDGKIDFEYNPETGDLRFKIDGQVLTTTGGQGSFVSSISLQSSSGQLRPGSASTGFTQGSGLTLTPNLLASALTSSPGFTDSFDFGNILAPGLTPDLLTGDLTVKYQVLNGGALKVGDLTITTVVPEPSSLALIGLAAASLLGRRRRKGNLKSEI